MMIDVLTYVIGLGFYGICGLAVVYYKTHGAEQGEWNLPALPRSGDGCAPSESAGHGRDER